MVNETLPLSQNGHALLAPLIVCGGMTTRHELSLSGSVKIKMALTQGMAQTAATRTNPNQILPPRMAPFARFQPGAEMGPLVLHGTILPSLLDEPMLELELSLAQFDSSQDFSSVVRTAARALNGDFLFDLPASGLIPLCTRIAAVRLKSNGEWITVFACLEPDGETIRVEAADEKTAHLHEFAGAFVHLLERF